MASGDTQSDADSAPAARPAPGTVPGPDPVALAGFAVSVAILVVLALIYGPL